MVFFSIMFGLGLSFLAHEFLHCRIDHQFFPDGMPSELPREVVRIALLVVEVVRVVDDLVIVLFKLSVVFFDGFRDGRHRR